MTPLYPSPFHVELHDDQSHQLPSHASQASLSSCSCSSFSSLVFYNLSGQDQRVSYHGETNHGLHRREADNISSGMYSGSENENGSTAELAISKREPSNEDRTEMDGVKWMPSKMRLMLKFKNSNLTAQDGRDGTRSVEKAEDQKLLSSPTETEDSNSNNSSPIRVCSDCNTTKTPLWRSGPQGPKSLCNACGIRQRKARVAMATAAAAETSANVSVDQNPPLKTKAPNKEKKSNGGHLTKYRKKSKLAGPPLSAPGRKNCFDDMLINLSDSLRLHRVFPQDEKEAAILLMALSCGYVHG